jgi:hypothetical protein
MLNILATLERIQVKHIKRKFTYILASIWFHSNIRRFNKVIFLRPQDIFLLLFDIF